ncbi:MAG: hypothetical protein ILP19_06705 [Oscillospiraceae bacterium]|nr:hypothetical protein [Oscillospiraceae bacterium]
MEDKELNTEHSAVQEMKKHYRSFAKQLSDWYCKGKNPELASKDTSFTLELQKQKLRSLGLDMQMKFGSPNESNSRVSAIYYDDSVFVNYIIGAKKHITTDISSSGKEISSSDDDGRLTVVMQNPKKGGTLSADTAVCCPNCGVPSTLGRLGAGCEFCGTKFLMNELYPKVMHIFVEEDGKPLYDKKQLKKYIVGGTVFFFAVSMVSLLYSAFTGETDSTSLLMSGLYYLFGSIISGALFGALAWYIANAVGAVKLMGKNARGGSKMIRSLIFCSKMHQMDPNFSTEYFRDKSMSLLKFMLYSTDPRDLTVCRCNKTLPEKLREIVDITYYNSGVDKYKIKNGVCDVSLTFYTDSLHYHGGKILRKSDKIRMSMRKVIKKPTDLSFSVMAVTCPSCGASFDVSKERDCPFCKNTYPLEENEWVVTDIRI